MICTLASIAPILLAALFGIILAFRIKAGTATNATERSIVMIVLGLIALALFNTVKFEGGGFKVDLSGRLCESLPSDGCANRKNMSVLVLSTDKREQDRTLLSTFLRKRGVDTDTSGSDLSEFDPRPQGTNRVIYDTCGEPLVRNQTLNQALQGWSGDIVYDDQPRAKIMQKRSIQILMY